MKEHYNFLKFIKINLAKFHRAELYLDKIKQFALFTKVIIINFFFLIAFFLLKYLY